MIRIWHVIACLAVFILLFNQDRQGVELKLMKNDHFNDHSAIWFVPHQVL